MEEHSAIQGDRLAKIVSEEFTRWLPPISTDNTTRWAVLGNVDVTTLVWCEKKAGLFVFQNSGFLAPSQQKRLILTYTATAI